MAAEQVEIRRIVEGSKGRYVASVASIDEAGELTYSIASPTLVIADHTSVPDALRGRGIARALAGRLVIDARAEGFKVIPLCPFVNAERRKHPEWSDVFA